MKKYVCSEKYKDYYPEGEEMTIEDYRNVGKAILSEKTNNIKRALKKCLKTK